MTKDEYIKKLERRIHNQRVALRENWEIVEERAKNRPARLESRWFKYYKRKLKEIKELKEKLEAKVNRK